MSTYAIHVATATLPPRVLIHGCEGVGKTTLAAKFPAPVFLQTEDGCPSKLTINTFGMLDSYKAVREALSFLAGEPHEHRAVVIDGLDVLEALIWRDVCASQGWASIEQPGYGKGYVVVDGWWLDILAGLDFLRRERGMTIVLLAHSAIERVDDPRAASYTSYQLRMHKRARSLVQDWADAILFLAPDLNVVSEDAGFSKKRTRAEGGSTRWLHCEARPSFVAKNRFGLPAKLMVPKDFDYDAALAPFFPPSAVTE
jgi:AAA domain